VATSAAITEANERVKVEAAWAGYWHFQDTFLSQPPSTWTSTVGKVAVERVYSLLLKQGRALLTAGIGSYGERILDPFWTKPVGGKKTAVLGDCQDGSNAGTVVVKSGFKRTVGKAHTNMQGTLVKGPDNVWRVQEVVYFPNLKCAG
jgi:hypothetical protein